MLKRTLFLILGAWLIAASSLAAHAGPCHSATAEIAAPALMQDHCEMMAAMGAPASGQPSDLPDPSVGEPPCCCPGMLAAVPAPEAPDTARLAFRLALALPADTSAPSRALIPEPPPPKA
ncbi:MAG: hypothetical protein ACK46Q_05510 [Hyphomonas sp.]